MITRRSLFAGFAAAASGLLLPELEPVRKAYSFFRPVMLRVMVECYHWEVDREASDVLGKHGVPVLSMTRRLYGVGTLHMAAGSYIERGTTVVTCPQTGLIAPASYPSYSNLIHMGVVLGPA